MFDADWAAHGHIENVVRRAAAWVEARRLAGLKLEVVRLAEADGTPRTPVLFFELPASAPGGNAPDAPTVLLYGHLDKQPEFSGWRADLGPWTPKYENGLLYGRGGADDGYAVYAAVSALQALDAQGVPRPRCVGLIETCEESGSGDLPATIDALRPRLGDVGLVVCLDSGAGNYDQLWLTTSLRGNVTGTLKVEVLTEGVHSGDSSGLVPSSFRVLRQLLDRLEDAATGRLLPQSLHCAIPPERVAQARERRRCWAPRCGSASPGPAAATAARSCRPPPTRPRRCSTAPGAPPSASPAPRVSRPSPTPATCCARTPPSS
jgi:acetylornithine deacetylase/succinyl-diaminopimelate desuccinylase-like protein